MPGGHRDRGMLLRAVPRVLVPGGGGVWVPGTREVDGRGICVKGCGRAARWIGNGEKGRRYGEEEKRLATGGFDLLPGALLG